MKRLEEKQLRKIKELRRNGKSLGEICEILGLRKTVVYYHIKKKFGKTYKIIKINQNDKNAIGEIMGVFAGDGNFCKDRKRCYQIRFYFSANENKYAGRFGKLLKKIFDKKPYIYVYGTPKNKILIRYKSKPVYQFILKYLSWNGRRTQTIRLNSINHTQDFNIGFLRGYFDAEGHSHSDRKKVEIVTISNTMAHQLVIMIRKLGLNPDVRLYMDKRGNRKPCYYISLKDKDAINFIHLIRPRNEKRIKSWARSLAW